MRALPKKVGQNLAVLEEEPGGKDVTEGPGWSTMARPFSFLWLPFPPHIWPVDRYELAPRDTLELAGCTQSQNHMRRRTPGFLNADTSPAATMQLDKAIIQGFKDVDADVRAKFPDGTTATLVLLKLSPDGEE